MKAIARLAVPPELTVEITLTLTVREVDALMVAMREVDDWPSPSLRLVLERTINKMRESHHSEHVVG